MLSQQTATVLKIKKDKVILKLANGEKIKWPKSALSEELKEGETINCLLTSSQNLLNEIIDAQK